MINGGCGARRETYSGKSGKKKFARSGTKRREKRMKQLHKDRPRKYIS